jgi:hypothetical protein
MKRLLGTMFCLASLFAIGCERNPAADATRNEAPLEADRIRMEADQKAEIIRDADGRTVLGNAQTTEGERRADAIEDAGERRADAVEEAGERRADQIEDRDRNINNRPIDDGTRSGGTTTGGG